MNSHPGKNDAAGPAPARCRRLPSRIFRWCRITVLLLVLGVVVLGIFLNKVGLPDSVKERLTARVRDKGWEVDFSRLRLRWYRGLVMDHLHLRRAGADPGPQLFADEAECAIRRKALLRLELEPAGVQLRGARLIWDLPGSNQPPRTLVINDIDGDLQFKPGDTWELRSLQAEFLGFKVRFHGQIAHASAIRDWKFPEATASAPAVSGGFWRRVLKVADQLHKAPSPLLHGAVRGDAADLRSLEARVQMFVPGFDSPWGGATNVSLDIALEPSTATASAFPVHLSFDAAHANTRWGSGTNVSIRARFQMPGPPGEPPRIEADLNIASARTPWGDAERFSAFVSGEPLKPDAIPSNCLVRLRAVDARTQWASGRSLRAEIRVVPCPTNATLRQTLLQAECADVRTEFAAAAAGAFQATVLHAPTNFFPSEVSATVNLERPESRWGQSSAARLTAQASLPPPSELALAHTNLPWPDRFASLPFQGAITVTNLNSPQVDFGQLSIATTWRPPQLEASLEAASASGQLAVKASLDAASRALAFNAAGNVHPRDFALLFPTNVQRFLAAFEWDPPPSLALRGQLALPAWTNRQPDWKGAVWPTVELAGHLEADESAFQNVPVTSVRAAFSLTNLAWHLAEFALTRPEGRLDLTGALDQRSGVFDARLRSTIDPQAAKPLVKNAKAQRVFDFFQFTEPPRVQAAVVGNMRDWARTGVDAEVALTNLTFRGEKVAGCSAHTLYTNKFVSILAPLILRPGEQATADGIGIDIAHDLLFLTNAHGIINPYALTRAIGPKTFKAIEPYKFDLPPAGRAHGTIDLKGSGHRDDVHFYVEGGSFQWKVFQLEQLAGDVLWRGHTVILTNVQGRWRGGPAQGWVFIDDTPPDGSTVAFSVAVTNVNFHDIMTDFGTKTNRVEGQLSAELHVTRLDTWDDLSWLGYGGVSLTNGYIWSLPVFGVFTPVLDSILPGLGSTRFKQGSGHFTITNSVIATKDLEFRAALMRMDCAGTVDFHERVSGRIEAELLRDFPGIGLLISRMLWPVTKLFTYRVTGTLDQPKSDAQYVVPKLLVVPFLPFKVMKDIVTDEGRNPSEKKPSPGPDK